MRFNYSRFVRNFVLNNFSHKMFYHPLNAQIEITMRCNARCVFCSIWTKDYQKQLDKEMTTAEIKHVMDGLAKLGVFEITLTGGEPTLRPDLPELLRYARYKGMMPAIATNGYYLYEMLRAGKLDAMEWVMISLDWPTKENHDRYRGIEVFERAVKGIRAAVHLKKQTLLSCVVTHENIGHMEDMCKFSRQMGAMMELLPCEDLIREQKDTEHVVEKARSLIPDLHQYADEIRRLVKIYPNLVTDIVTASVMEAGGFGYQDLLHCISAEAYVNVRYNGEMVFPCKIHPILSVDVRKKSPYDVYYSKEAREIMLKKDTYPFCKGCRLGCAIITTIPAHFSTLYEKYIKAFLNGNFF